MLVVSDATAINILIRLQLTDVLPSLFSQVAIPIAVADELSHARAPIVVQDFVRSPPAWLIVRSPTTLLPLFKLGAGEHAAISLAHELNAAALLMDEKRGRREAAKLHLRVVGTIGILEMAAERDLIDLADALQRIRQTDFSVADEIIDGAIQRDAKRRGDST